MAMKRCPICGEKYSDKPQELPLLRGEEEALQSWRTDPQDRPGRAANGRPPAAASLIC